MWNTGKELRFSFSCLKILNSSAFRNYNYGHKILDRIAILQKVGPYIQGF